MPLSSSSSTSAKGLHLNGAQALLIVGGGVFLAVSLLVGLMHYSGQPLIMASFGASGVLLFGYRQGPFSQARNVIGGHLIAALVGLMCLHLIGDYWWSMALSCSIATTAMIATRTMHPPAGGTPVLVFLANSPWSFLFTPTLVGAVSLVLIAKLFWWLLLRDWPRRE